LVRAVSPRRLETPSAPIGIALDRGRIVVRLRSWRHPVVRRPSDGVRRIRVRWAGV